MVTVQLDPAHEVRLGQLAQTSGQDATELARRILEDYLDLHELPEASELEFAEASVALAPEVMDEKSWTEDDHSEDSMRLPYWIQGNVRDKGYCVYCGRDMLVDVSVFYGFLECDHLIPEAGRGASTFDNHATSCRTCNHLKGKFVPVGHESMSREMLISAFWKYIQDRLKKIEPQFLERRRLCRGS